MARRESHKLVIRDGRFNVLFLQRRWNANFNGGGIDFPGGKPEKVDSSPLETAIRETGEEIGLWLRPAQCSPQPLLEHRYTDNGDDFYKTAWLAVVPELPQQRDFLPSDEHIGSIALRREIALGMVRQPFEIGALQLLGV